MDEENKKRKKNFTYTFTYSVWWAIAQFSPTSPGSNPYGHLEPEMVAGPPAESNIPPPPPPSPKSAKRREEPMHLGVQYVQSSQYWDPSHPRSTLTDLYQNNRYQFTRRPEELHAELSGTAKPILPRTAQEFERRHKELSRLAMAWVEKYFTPEIGYPWLRGVDVMNWGKRNPVLVRWIDSVATAYGLSWLRLLSTAKNLLVMAVLGKVLEDRVFKNEFFGGSEEDKILLRQIDRELEEKEVFEVENDYPLSSNDAFARQKPRAIFINGGLHFPGELPVNFAGEVFYLYHQLVQLLQPLLDTRPDHFPDAGYYNTLDVIIVMAGKLSLDMRREPDTVYYVATTPPWFKRMDPKRMSPVIFDLKDIESDAARFVFYSNVISVWPGVFAYSRLSHNSVSVRTIHRALVYTMAIYELNEVQLAERDLEKVVTMGQLWEYLRSGAVSGEWDRRFWCY